MEKLSMDKIKAESNSKREVLCFFFNTKQGVIPYWDYKPKIDYNS